MNVGAMEVPVAQAGPPNAQSAPCTPPKSSQKIQDEEESNEEPVEFDDEDVVLARPESLGIGSCLANGTKPPH